MPSILHLNRNLSELDHGESSPKNLLVYIYIYIYQQFGLHETSGGSLVVKHFVGLLPHLSASV